MKKKMLCIAIVSLFLLTCLSSLSAVGNKIKKASDTDSTIELRLTVKDLHAIILKRPFYPPAYLGYGAQINVENVGTTTLKKSEYPKLELLYTTEFEGLELYNETVNWWLCMDEVVVEPGQIVAFSHSWDHDQEYLPPKSKLTAFVDSKNLIPEWEDYNNNYWEEIGPDVKSRNRFFNNELLLKILNRLPILHQLLNL